MRSINGLRSEKITCKQVDKLIVCYLPGNPGGRQWIVQTPDGELVAHFPSEDQAYEVAHKGEAALRRAIANAS